MKSLMLIAQFTALALVFVSALFAASDVSAQTCSGTVECGTQLVTTCVNSAGEPCIEGSAGCNCSDDCGGARTSVQCSNYSMCSAVNICQSIVGVCYISGSCTTEGLPPPAPPSSGGGTRRGATIRGLMWYGAAPRTHVIDLAGPAFLLVGRVEEGHPEYGCTNDPDPDVHPLCDQDQENESFDLYCNGELIFSYRDRGARYEQWFPVSQSINLPAGENICQVFHINTEADPDSDGGSVRYELSFIISDSPGPYPPSPGAPGWYQVLGGGVLAGGNTISPIPPSCATSPSCIDVLLLDDPVSSVPATVVYGGSTANFSAGAGGGNVSSTGWISNSSTTAGAYSYSYFSNLASGKAFTDVPAGNINTGSVSSAPVDSDGYTWVRVNGNATVAQPLNIDNQKVVLFVDGNLNIANRITLNNTTNSFLMVIARGNITIDPSLSSSSATDYALSGVFFTDGTFATGAANSRLVIRGSVSATNINLQRDLLANNNDTPAELFIYSPEVMTMFPVGLAPRSLIWREVTP